MQHKSFRILDSFHRFSIFPSRYSSSSRNESSFFAKQKPPSKGAAAAYPSIYLLTYPRSFSSNSVQSLLGSVRALVPPETGLIARVSSVCEFTDSLEPRLRNSASQSAKLNPTSGEMCLAFAKSDSSSGFLFGPRNLITRRFLPSVGARGHARVRNSSIARTPASLPPSHWPC